FTGLIAWLGLVSLLSRGPRPVEELSIDAGLVYLSVGGAWTVVSRYGARPLGFSDLIVLATAVHFHYAGFVLPLLTGLAGRLLRSRTAQHTAVGVVLGVPLVAVGITLSAFDIRWVEWAAAWFLAVAAMMVAGLQFQLAGRTVSWTSRLLLSVSGLSLLIGMLLAAVYAFGTYWGHDWLDIPFMLPFHGAVDALGFALPGVLVWNLDLSLRSGSERKTISGSEP